jgi:hypothetical protein
MLFGVPTTFDGDSIVNVLLVIIVQELRTSRIVGQEEDDQSNRQHGQYPFNNEQPSETLKTTSTVEMANAIGYAAPEGSRGCC